MAERTAIGTICWRAPLMLAIMVCAWLIAHSAAIAETLRPQRIVSINMCADGLVLALADPTQIVSLSYLSHDPRNVDWAKAAAAYATNRGRAEEVRALSPDLVLASTFTTPATLSMLRRLGTPVITLEAPHTFDAIRAQIRLVAEHIGQQKRGEATIESMDARLANIAITTAVPAMKALVLQSNNIVAGAETLPNSIMKEAGLINIAAQAGISGYGRMSLEAILNSRPDVIIIDASEKDSPARASQLLHHPALLALKRQGTRVISIPPRLWVCAGPGSVEAVAYLRQTSQAAP